MTTPAEIENLYHGILDGWNNRSAAVYHNTPAAFHGRPEMSAALTEELRGLL